MTTANTSSIKQVTVAGGGVLGSQIAMQMDDDYIRALEYAMPPTSGWGMGIDRFTQLITDTETIKDVILFPSMRKEE